MPNLPPKHFFLRWMLLALLLILLDQASKWGIRAWLPLGTQVPVLPFFTLTFVYNPGAAFSFLAWAPGWQVWLFSGLAFVVSGALIYLLYKSPRWGLVNLAYTFVLSGALGNLIDRLSFCQVVDFLYFHYHSFSFPAFNVADSAISIGVALLFWDAFLGAGAKRRDPLKAVAENGKLDSTPAPKKPARAKRKPAKAKP